LQAEDAELRSAALWILRHHPDWAPKTAKLAAELLRSEPGNPAAGEEQKNLLRVLAVAPAVQAVIAHHLPSLPLPDQAKLLECVAQAHPRDFSPLWVAAVREAVRRRETPLVPAALAAAREFRNDHGKWGAPGSDLNVELLALARDAAQPGDARLDALLALAGKTTPLDGPLLGFVLGSLAGNESPARRARALEVLLRSQLDSASLEEVAAALPRVGPLELPRLLAVFEQSPQEAVGRRLLVALREAKAARSLPGGTLQAVFARFPAANQADFAAFLQTLDTDLPKKAAHLESLLTELKTLRGEVRRGQTVFNSSKAACLACHQVGYLGGHVGPDLTSIGQARSERDLLESIVYPSASFVRGYEPVVVATKQGEEHTGVVKKDAAEELVLATGPNAEVRVRRAEIAELRPGTVSIMPQGLDEQLSRQELADLLAFLKDTRWGPR
jgi:putative heme-binding domain-containing protein